MKSGSIILDSDRFRITLERLAHQIIENYQSFDDTYIIGIQEKGVVLAKRLQQIINEKQSSNPVKLGTLDISFYRDDFRTSDKLIKVSETDIPFSIESKNVILVDDVLFSGRTVQAGISALQDFGRPLKVELLVLVDRRFNRHLPIKADYIGISVDALDQAYVRVHLDEHDGVDQVLFFSAKENES